MCMHMAQWFADCCLHAAALLCCRPEMVVGWYHSHPGFGCWLSGVDINTQQVRGLGNHSQCGAK
jgi:proteasome lid subunit RPN8/RPN11